MSAGTIAPIARWTTSPGTRAVTSISPGVPSRTTTARCVTRECKASAARSARNSLLNPRPTLTSRITPMTIEFVASPRNSESPAVMSSRIRMGLASCRPSTDHPLALWVRTALGPSSARRLVCFGAGQSVLAGAQLSQHRGRGPARGAGDRQRRGVGLLEVELWHAESVHDNSFKRKAYVPGKRFRRLWTRSPCGARVSGWIYSPGTVLQQAVGLFFDPAGRCRIRHLPRWEAPPGRLDLSETAQQISGQRVNRKFNKPAPAGTGAQQLRRGGVP